MKRKLIATLLRASGIEAKILEEIVAESPPGRPNKFLKFLNFTLMARNTKPDYKCVECNFDVQKDFERTKPNLGLTPQQVAEMAKRGIPVSPMNVNFIDVNGDASWNIDPQFRRDMDMATAWEMEKASQRKALQVLRQKKFGDKYINPQNN
nr:MAG TPA: hypothetical protein [Microviridae sp.]